MKETLHPGIDVRILFMLAISLAMVAAISPAATAYSTAGSATSNLTYELVVNDDTGTGVVYTPNCIGTCHLVIKILYDGQIQPATKDFSLSDKNSINSYFSVKNLYDNVNVTDVRVLISAKHNYSVPVYKNVTTKVAKNDSNLTKPFGCTDLDSKNWECTSSVIDSYKTLTKETNEWTSLGTKATFEKGKYYYLDFVGTRKPKIGQYSADIVPVVNNIALTDLAWWDSNWKNCMNINVSGYIPKNGTIYMVINSTYFNTSKMQTDMDDMRFFNGTCDSPGNALKQWLMNRNPSGNTFAFVMADTENMTQMAVYYNNSAATNVNDFTTAFWSADNFDDNDIVNWNVTAGAFAGNNGFLNSTGGATRNDVHKYFPKFTGGSIMLINISSSSSGDWLQYYSGSNLSAGTYRPSYNATGVTITGNSHKFIFGCGDDNCYSESGTFGPYVTNTFTQEMKIYKSNGAVDLFNITSAFNINLMSSTTDSYPAAERSTMGEYTTNSNMLVDYIAIGRYGSNTSYVYDSEKTASAPDSFDINYASPTLNNTANTSSNYIFVNATIDATGTFDKCTLQWNGVNETMTAHSSNTFCYLNKTGLASGIYAFKVFGNDTNNLIDAETLRTVTVDVDLPVIAYVTPTPTNANTIGVNFAYINITSTDATTPITGCVLQWAGTNETLTMNASGLARYCYLNKTGLTSGTYTYKTFSNDTVNNTQQGATQTITIDIGAPTVAYVSPIPADGSTVKVNYAFINSTSTDAISAISNCVLQWNGVNESMTMNVSGLSRNCYVNKTSLTNGVTYTYKIFSNDTLNNTVQGATRTVIIDTVTPSQPNLTITSVPVNSTLTLNATNSTAFELNTNLSYSYRIYDLNKSLELRAFSTNTSYFVNETLAHDYLQIQGRTTNGRWCHQESFNTSNQLGTDGDCSLKYTGNFRNNSYNLFETTGGYLTINYTKPDGVLNGTQLNVTLIVNASDPLYGNQLQQVNETFILPAACLLQENTSVKYIWDYNSSRSPYMSLFNISCYNTTEYQTLKVFTLGRTFSQLFTSTNLPDEYGANFNDGDYNSSSYQWIFDNATEPYNSLLKPMWKGPGWYALAEESMNWLISVNSTTAEQNITILNTIPNITSVTLSPLPANSTDNLTLTYTCTDLDNDTCNISAEYNWYKNGVALNYNVSILNATNLSSNDQIIGSVRTYDNYSYSDWKNSSTLVIGDTTAPNLTNFTLSGQNITSIDTELITVNCSDSGILSFVYVEITDPNSVALNYSMTNTTPNIYTKLYTPSALGIYSARIICSDTSNNLINTTALLFNVTQYTAPGNNGNSGGGIPIISNTTCQVGYSLQFDSSLNESICKPDQPSLDLGSSNVAMLTLLIIAGGTVWIITNESRHRSRKKKQESFKKYY